MTAFVQVLNGLAGLILVLQILFDLDLVLVIELKGTSLPKLWKFEIIFLGRIIPEEALVLWGVLQWHGLIFTEIIQRLTQGRRSQRVKTLAIPPKIKSRL